MNLLIVDDEVVTTQVLAEKLDREALGVKEIFVAYSVGTAEEILKSERAEIILCDIEMPGANGLELLEWVHSNQEETEFLFLTSHEKFEYAFGAIRQGASGYLLKPIDIFQIQQELLRVAEKIRNARYREEMVMYAVSHIQDKEESFFRSGMKEERKKTDCMLEQKFVLQCFEKGERVKLLEYLQKSIVCIKKKDGGNIGLEYFQMNLLQIAGAYLHKHDISAEFLFTDAGYKRIWEKSRTSEFCMVQWSTYYVNRIFEAVQDREKGKSLVDTVVDYIHAHYEENISRNLLARKVGFSPEYVGKMFRKKMGMGINEYTNILRIEKAKNLLGNTDHKVIDVAMMVGYDNMPYFSSVFKKYVGISPVEFKKQ